MFLTPKLPKIKKSRENPWVLVSGRTKPTSTDCSSAEKKKQQNRRPKKAKPRKIASDTLLYSYKAIKHYRWGCWNGWISVISTPSALGFFPFLEPEKKHKYIWRFKPVYSLNFFMKWVQFSIIFLVTFFWRRYDFRIFRSICKRIYFCIFGNNYQYFFSVFFWNSASKFDLLKIHQDSCWHMTRMLEAHSQGPGPVPKSVGGTNFAIRHCEKTTHML